MISGTDKIIDILWSYKHQESKEQVFAILDGARDESIYPAVVNSDNEYECLYGEEVCQDLAEVAPYFVKLDKNNAFTKWLIGNGWGKSWGIFIKSDATFHELKKHFRQFLMVRDEKNKHLYFRYYDPRVLRVYLPACNKDDLKTFYGPVSCYYTEGNEVNLIHEYICLKNFKLVMDKKVIIP